MARAANYEQKCMILSEHSIVSDLENDIGKMSNHLHEMDDILLEANKIAKKYDLGSMHYESESYHIDYVTGFLKSIEEYVCGLRYSLSREIENPAAQELTEKVINPLKSIDLMKITTYNTVGVKERNTFLSENDVYAYREKESLTFADFMGGGDDENSLWKNVGYVDGFHELFEADYEYYKEYYTTYDAYLNNAYIWSQDTQMKKQSESDAWDFTVVKPLIEIITGEDWIMHTKLTEEQKKLKAMGIFVDVSMFLFSFVTGGESLTAGSVVKALMVEMVTGMSTVGVTRFANAYNLSPGVTMLLMFLVGTFTGVAANSAFDFIEDGIDDWVRHHGDDIHFILFGDGCEHFSYDPVRDYDNFINEKKVAGAVEEVADVDSNGQIRRYASEPTASIGENISWIDSVDDAMYGKSGIKTDGEHLSIMYIEKDGNIYTLNLPQKIKTEKGMEISFTNPSGATLNWVDQDKKNILISIENAKTSLNPGTKIEAKVADFVQQHTEVKQFGLKVWCNDLQVTDLDVVTDDMIIEVKKSASSLKIDQIKRMIDPSDLHFVNYDNKRVIVYIDESISGITSKFTLEKLQYLEDHNIPIANSLDELERMLK